MPTNNHGSADVPVLTVDLSEIPALLDVEGVRKHLAPLGRTLLYALAGRGEIESASLGLKRGKRVFVTASIVRWLEARIAVTLRPKMGGGAFSEAEEKLRRKPNGHPPLPALPEAVSAIEKEVAQ